MASRQLSPCHCKDHTQADYLVSNKGFASSGTSLVKFTGSCFERQVTFSRCLTSPLLPGEGALVMGCHLTHAFQGFLRKSYLLDNLIRHQAIQTNTNDKLLNHN